MGLPHPSTLSDSSQPRPWHHSHQQRPTMPSLNCRPSITTSTSKAHGESGSPHNLPSPCLTNAHPPPTANWHCTAGGRGSVPACIVAYPPAATVKIRVLVTLS